MNKVQMLKDVRETVLNKMVQLDNEFKTRGRLTDSEKAMKEHTEKYLIDIYNTISNLIKIELLSSENLGLLKEYGVSINKELIFPLMKSIDGEKIKEQ